MKILRVILLFILLMPNCHAQEFLYILNDDCINELYTNARNFFRDTPIDVIRDTRGILLRYELPNPQREYKIMSLETYKKTIYIQQFLAKIKNPAIIEVHTEKNSSQSSSELKNWEISTVIANRIEDVILKPKGMIAQKRIHSVGYGEFLPDKNTSYNGGNNSNRVDIMILCNVSGE